MKPSTTVIPIEGMRCAGCSTTIEKKLREVSSVDWVSVNFASKKAFIALKIYDIVLFKTLVQYVKVTDELIMSNQLIKPYRQLMFEFTTVRERQIVYIDQILSTMNVDICFIQNAVENLSDSTPLPLR